MKIIVTAIKTVLSRYLSDELVERLLREIREELLKEREIA